MILITEFMDETAVERLRSGFDVDYDPGLADRQDDIGARLADKRALIVRNRTRVTKELVETAPGLVCVGRLGVGLDNIDLEACAANDVAVYPAAGANALSVAEYVITATLVLLRNAYLSTGRTIAGEWPRQDCSGREAAGKCLGLVGFGDVGRETARLASAIGMQTMAYDPLLADEVDWGATRRGSLEAVLAESDAVSLHVPLTKATRYLINSERLVLMKPNAVLINTARGGVVDEAALVDALRHGRVGGAALDVFEHEPLTADGGADFKDLPNLLLTPHIAGVTDESNARVSAMIADKVREHLIDAVSR